MGLDRMIVKIVVVRAMWFIKAKRRIAGLVVAVQKKHALIVGAKAKYTSDYFQNFCIPFCLLIL